MEGEQTKSTNQPIMGIVPGGDYGKEGFSPHTSMKVKERRGTLTEELHQV